MEEWIRLILEKWGVLGATVLIAIMYRRPLSALAMRLFDDGRDSDNNIEHALEVHNNNRRISEERMAERLSAILHTLEGIERILGDIRIHLAEMKVMKGKRQ